MVFRGGFFFFFLPSCYCRLIELSVLWMLSKHSFLGGGILCGFGVCLGTHSVDQAGLNVCATTEQAFLYLIVSLMLLRLGLAKLPLQALDCEPPALPPPPK